MVLLVIVAGLAAMWFSLAVRRAATEDGAIRDFHDFTGEQLEQEVRSRVPLGSPRVFVEGFLTGEGMRFTYVPSMNAIVADAPCLKGTGIILVSLGLTFRFDKDSRLTAIDAKVQLTGP